MHERNFSLQVKQADIVSLQSVMHTLYFWVYSQILRFTVWYSLSTRQNCPTERTRVNTQPTAKWAELQPHSSPQTEVTQLERDQHLAELISHRSPVPRSKSAPSKEMSCA